VVERAMGKALAQTDAPVADDDVEDEDEDVGNAA
jgi:hypothetical protein